MTTTVCPLCERPAVVRRVQNAQWEIECGTCTQFTIDDYLFDVIKQARQRSDERVLALLPDLSSAARMTREDGGRLNWPERTSEESRPM